MNFRERDIKWAGVVIFVVVFLSIRRDMRRSLDCAWLTRVVVSLNVTCVRIATMCSGIIVRLYFPVVCTHHAHSDYAEPISKTLQSDLDDIPALTQLNRDQFERFV